jgi:glycosyltransferase involved in cell wall biosynthesis
MAIVFNRQKRRNFQKKEMKTNWEVPEYKEIYREERSRNFCVVIPVVNEGERIKSLLRKMEKARIYEIADILIIDGGTTDGSLESNWLKERRVRVLLRKTGAGKLSAQLRCAYAFALQTGYRGIITIDGNDKDDPEAIPAFVNALESGVDFAQASRFIEGGQAVNTPRSRDLAIRLLHAPALSLFSGFKWTDTTQGFRAYSDKLLLDERVAPFRNLFSSYELLAYLSYCAPRLGFRCVEIPTRRIYPDGTTPTKIAGVRGNLQLLLTLASACIGRYNPPGKKEILPSKGATVFLYTIFACLSAALNLFAQKLVLIFYEGEFRIKAAIFAGTLSGIAIKYVLDKKYIFCYETKNLRHDVGKLFLYTMMSVVTTLVFWGSEAAAYSLALHFLCDKVVAERVMLGGAAFGLTLGYVLKYHLDKRFVFNKNKV